MSREWTEKHIRELIRQNPKFEAGNGKETLIEQIGSVTGLELHYNVYYPVFTTGNGIFFKIAIPEDTILLTPKFAEIFAGKMSAEVPAELVIDIGSPFAPLPEDGHHICDLLAVPDAKYQVKGGWMDSTTLTSTPDDALIYPMVSLNPKDFEGKRFDSGETLHITEYTHSVWLSSTQSVPVTCYGVFLNGLTAWPRSWQFNMHTTVTIGG